MPKYEINYVIPWGLSGKGYLGHHVKFSPLEFDRSVIEGHIVSLRGVELGEAPLLEEDPERIGEIHKIVIVDKGGGRDTCDKKLRDVEYALDDLIENVRTQH
jgi:hypothetical protein